MQGASREHEQKVIRRQKQKRKGFPLQALEEEHFQFVGIGTVKCIRDTRFDRSFRLL